MSINKKIIDGILFDDTGEMLITGAPEGGIIDRNPTLNKWFVIFNDNREPLEDWFDTRDDAIAAFEASNEEQRRLNVLLTAFVL